MGEDDLVIERSAPVAPDQVEIAAWLADQHVFISSVIEGMHDERTAVADAVERAGARPIWFERFGGRDDHPEAAYLAEVGRCTLYVGILGERYGRPLLSGYSATHVEYDEAQRRGLRTSIWVSATDHDGRQTDFINEVAVFHTYGTYVDASSLSDGVGNRLAVLAAEGLSPWAKLGPVVFRTSKVRAAGNRIQVDAIIRDDDVLAGLLRLRERRYRSAEPLHFTHDLGSTPIEVDDITVETTAGGARKLEISLSPRVRGGFPGMVDVATEGRSPENLTELALRINLFGEDNPLGLMSFMTRLPNPFDLIAASHLSEEVIGAVVRVLLTEILVSSGRAERITAFRLGINHRGSRRLAISWLPRQRYSNILPEERHVEGEVRV